jgi:plasmid stabilization system protein ParE
MDYQLIWTQEALDDLDAIIVYWTDIVSSARADKFVAMIYKKLDLLVSMPFIGVKSRKREMVRRLIIDKRYSLAYIVIVDEIYLLRLFDNRQDPAKYGF